MKTQVAFLAATLALAANAGEVQVLPFGPFRAVDGRPGNGKSWVGDAATAKRIMDRLNSLKNSLVIDYEHQTFLTKTNGQPAPAAGWFDKFTWKEGVGLFASVRWTDRAKQMIDNKEYAYFSPSIQYDASGQIVGLLPSAITNFPAIDGMAELFSAVANFQTEQEPPMKHAQLLVACLAAIGMAESADEAAAMTAFTALKAKADGADAATTELATLKTEVATLKTNTKPDPSKFVSVEAFEAVKTELATLTASAQGREIEDLIAPALADGRILPAQEKWARELGASNIAQLKTYIDTAKPIAALGGSQTGGKQPTGTDGKPVVSDTQLALCKQLGITPEDYSKSLAAEAA